MKQQAGGIVLFIDSRATRMQPESSFTLRPEKAYLLGFRPEPLLFAISAAWPGAQEIDWPDNCPSLYRNFVRLKEQIRYYFVWNKSFRMNPSLTVGVLNY
ncbi:MAG: hypothetical protein L0229_16500 [Blastocatellia bacterium]|nr:hypothetical protein [Blastocatellia bacterium]